MPPRFRTAFQNILPDHLPVAGGLMVTLLALLIPGLPLLLRLLLVIVAAALLSVLFYRAYLEYLALEEARELPEDAFVPLEPLELPGQRNAP